MCLRMREGERVPPSIYYVRCVCVCVYACLDLSINQSIDVYE